MILHLILFFPAYWAFVASVYLFFQSFPIGLYAFIAAAVVHSGNSKRKYVVHNSCLRMLTAVNEVVC